MDMQCLLGHMKNQSININGTVYKLDASGVAKGVAQKDAERLLRNPDAWQAYQAPKGPPATARRQRVLLEEPAEAPQVAPEPPAAPELPQEPEAAPEEPASEDEGEDYPDPTEDMSIEKLREMAEAYEIPGFKKLNKKALVKKIMAAMYPPEE